MKTDYRVEKLKRDVEGLKKFMDKIDSQASALIAEEEKVVENNDLTENLFALKCELMNLEHHFSLLIEQRIDMYALEKEIRSRDPDNYIVLKSTILGGLLGLIGSAVLIHFGVI